MKNLKAGFAAAVLIAGAILLFLQYQAQEKLRAQNEALAQQLAQLQTDNQNLSNRLAAAGDSKSLSDEQLNELLKLRGEDGVLRQQVSELGKLREENQRLLTVVDAAKQQQETTVQKLSDAKQVGLALIMFEADNQDQFPTNFSQVSTYADNGFMDQIETNFDIVYQGSITNIAGSAATIVLKEKQAWQGIDGNWMKIYDFADGHSEIRSEPNDNFDDYEKDHIVPPPPNQ